MSSSSTNDIYLKWAEILKIELKEKSKINVKQRMAKIEKIVNNVTATQISSATAISSAISERDFYISNDDKLKMMKQIENKIDAWPGVEIGVCINKEKKNFRSYQATARNWFNRNKAKIYGNYLFYEIIFSHILQFCSHLPASSTSTGDKMLLFIEIFECILSEPVQFPRTKLQPLLPHQTLMQPNRFKKACQCFTNFYNIQWISNNTQKDRDRAKKIHNSFTNCLAKIKNQPIDKIPYPFHLIMDEKITMTTPQTTTIDDDNKNKDMPPHIDIDIDIDNNNNDEYDYNYTMNHGDYDQLNHFNHFNPYNSFSNSFSNINPFEPSFINETAQTNHCLNYSPVIDQLPQLTQIPQIPHTQLCLSSSSSSSSASSASSSYAPSRGTCHYNHVSQTRYSPINYIDNNVDNDSFVFTNNYLSNISSPTPTTTPWLGGFL